MYKVRSKEDGKLYAVKIALERYRGLSDRKEKLEEVRKHQFLLPHTNCVRFYQSWEDNGRLYQKFELCQKSLMDVSEEKHDLPESQIWDYLIDLLLAVQHLHDHDLIHMDIKPENIFIGMDGICKLGDFGLVIDIAKMDSSKVVEGDPRYLASEVLTERKFTKAADIFALGVTILELATDLDLPKHGHLWHQLRQTGPDPQLTKHLSQDLRSVIQHMMLNDHERRPTVEQVLKIPAVKKHKAARMRKLAFQQFFQGVKSTFGAYLWPVAAFLIMLFNLVIKAPVQAIQAKIQRCYDDSEMHTPVLASNQNGGFLAPYPPKPTGSNKVLGTVSFSSEESDSNQSLATPLRINFSDEDEDENEAVFSPSHPRRSKRNLKNQKYVFEKKNLLSILDNFGFIFRLKFEEPLQPMKRKFDISPRSAPSKVLMGPPAISTPKTAAASRFRAHYLASQTPSFSPKKKLDFDSHDSSSLDGSPRLRRTFDMDQQHPTPSSSRISDDIHENSSYNIDADVSTNNLSSTATIKPVSLASKFDCFSDSD